MAALVLSHNLVKHQVMRRRGVRFDVIRVTQVWRAEKDKNLHYIDLTEDYNSNKLWAFSTHFAIIVEVRVKAHTVSACSL